MEFKIDKLIRSKRRTASIEISKNAELILRVPLKADNKYIETLLADKAKWILKHLSIMKERVQKVQKHEFINGEKILFLGIEREIVNNFTGSYTLKLKRRSALLFG